MVFMTWPVVLPWNSSVSQLVRSVFFGRALSVLAELGGLLRWPKKQQHRGGLTHFGWFSRSRHPNTGGLGKGFWAHTGGWGGGLTYWEQSIGESSLTQTLHGTGIVPHIHPRSTMPMYVYPYMECLG